MSFLNLFKEKAGQAKESFDTSGVKDKAADAKSEALDKAAEAAGKAAEVKDKAAAEVKDKAAEVKDKFAPAIKDLTAEAGRLGKEAETELKLLADQAKDIKRGGVTALIKKPDEDDIIALSRKARRKAIRLERKAAKLERKLKKIEKKQKKHLKKLEKESRGQ